jgi:hypothetical protein
MMPRTPMSRISATTHSKMVRDIYKNADIPGDQKRQLIDGLYFNMIEVAKAGKEMAKAAQE